MSLSYLHFYNSCLQPWPISIFFLINLLEHSSSCGIELFSLTYCKCFSLWLASYICVVQIKNVYFFWSSLSVCLLLCCSADFPITKLDIFSQFSFWPQIIGSTLGLLFCSIYLSVCSAPEACICSGLSHVRCPVPLFFPSLYPIPLHSGKCLYPDIDLQC